MLIDRHYSVGISKNAFWRLKVQEIVRTPYTIILSELTVSLSESSELTILKPLCSNFCPYFGLSMSIVPSFALTTTSWPSTSGVVDVVVDVVVTICVRPNIRVVSRIFGIWLFSSKMFVVHFGFSLRTKQILF